MDSNLTRAYWLSVLERIARPVLESLATGQLRQKMPVEAAASMRDRAQFSHLEAFARLLCGIAPWLELESTESEAENALKTEFRALAQSAMRQATDPASPDYLNFESGQQPLVEIGFFSQAILRAPNVLWAQMDEESQKNIVAAIKSSRTRKPARSNWLLFCGTAEAALHKIGAGADLMRLDYALSQHESWYLGDGIYGDGPRFHADYYNAFVIQPMLVDILRAVGEESEWKHLREPMFQRARRFAAIQERSISPEGTFAPVGRSLCYRCGALQGLAQAALLETLPDEVSPAMARCSLNAVIARMIEAPGTFDENGWLRIGFCGAQPSLGENYISTGSLYLCSAALLPLGLPSNNPFWSAPDEEWTAQKIWGGQDMPTDHSI